jgi:hypothetical protein
LGQHQHQPPRPWLCTYARSLCLTNEVGRSCHDLRRLGLKWCAWLAVVLAAQNLRLLLGCRYAR